MRGLCKVPSSPDGERGTPRARPLSPLPSRCRRRRKVPVCPQPPKPRGRGDALQRDKIVFTQRDKLTDTNTKVHDRAPPTRLTLPSLKRRPERLRTAGRQARGQSVPPGGTRSPPRARRRRPLGRPRSRRGPALTSGRPLLNLFPARGPEGSEGHDGSAPRVDVSQHRLIAADLPGLGGFRTALLSLRFLPAAPGAFP